MRFKDDLQRYIYYTSQIDYCYWAIQSISKHTYDACDPLTALIDKATGFDKIKVKNNISNVREAIKTIIRCKKKLSFDTERDEEFLNHLKKI